MPLSHGVRAGDLLFVSGQIATSPGGAPLIGDLDAQVNGALDNLEATLSAAGATLHQVAKVSAFLSNAVLFAPLNEIYSSRFGQAPPARTTLVVNFGHPDAGSRSRRSLTWAEREVSSTACPVALSPMSLRRDPGSPRAQRRSSHAS